VAEGLGLAADAARVDLHGLGAAEARAAVLCALRALQERAAQGAPLPHALTIITGRVLDLSLVRVLGSFPGTHSGVCCGSVLWHACVRRRVRGGPEAERTADG